MLNDSIYAYFFTLTEYNKAPIGSKEERVFQDLKELARDELKANCRSYSEYFRISRHVDYLSNRVVWPGLYKNVDSIHYSINRKAR